MNLLTSLRLFLGDTAVAFLAFALGVMLCPSVQNLLATLTGLTARLAARCGPVATAGAANTATGAAGASAGSAVAASAGGAAAASSGKPA